MIINVLISTIDGGIYNTGNVLLEPREDVHYLIIHQYTEEKYKVIPDFLKRSDTIVRHLPGKGVTKSRNEAIRHARGDIGLFSDDDVTYCHDDFDKIREIFLSNNDLDVGLFKIRTGPDEPEYKRYPAQVTTYERAPSVGTIEVAFRIDRLQRSTIRFDERFGAGQPLLIGSDERIFIQDCIDQGLKVKFFPEYIVQHPYESTVNSIPKYDKRKIWVTGGYDCRTNGPVAIVKAFLGTIKFLPDLIRNIVNPLFYLYHRLAAAMYILRTKPYEPKNDE